jgi:dTDP-4-amino-4,6-dideoxygalactose transaminase
MKNPLGPIGFAPPPIDESTVEAVVRVLRSGWITSGPELAAFEQELAAFCEVPDAVALGSWTAACELVLRWWGVGPGDEVILPAITYAATANIVLHCGATPVIVDIDPDCYQLTPQRLRAAITPHTKVVMPVDLAGWPVDYVGISSLLEEPAIREQFRPSNALQAQVGRPLFLADAAHSFGARVNGKRLGGQADVVGFSFHAVKNLTTAEGGGLCWNLPSGLDSAEFRKWIKTWSLHGATRDAHTKTLGGSWHYDIVGAGYKCNMTDLQAAMGRAQLKQYAGQLERRREWAFRYDRALSDAHWYVAPPLESAGRQSSFHLFTPRIKGFRAAQRDELIQRLQGDGIATNVHFIPLPMLTVHRDRGLRMADYPHAACYFDEVISLPLHLQLTAEQVDWVAERFRFHVEELLQTDPLAP